ncbi:sensor histidine kinase [Chitinophaga skermanii]|uniref:sensor histidine kinase n=1 Tax=Chitinophaga skermanii TaxID=331697 RepID=UPI001314C5C6|nr:ATP-binding protein [Chitinophaga skermanii]
MQKLQTGKGITFIYIILLGYIVLALIWWGILLFRQSHQIKAYEEQNLALRLDSLTTPVSYHVELERIRHDEQMRTFKFFGEGATFLGFILLGAAIVYRAVWKQIKLSRQQQNFMMAVTHELKSPIAAAKLNLETIRKRKLDEEKQNKLLENTIRETDRLDQLCNNILLASQFENSKAQLFVEPVNMSQLVKAGVENIQQHRTSHIVEAYITPGIWMEGDKFMLGLVLSNLVENAIKYAPKGSTISVKLYEKDKLLKWQVIDQGDGIPNSEKEKIFQKFYRVGNENTRKAKGTGLGLYLTKRIVEQHGGEIAAKDNPGGGTIFELSFGDYSIQHA